MSDFCYVFWVAIILQMSDRFTMLPFCCSNRSFWFKFEQSPHQIVFLLTFEEHSFSCHEQSQHHRDYFNAVLLSVSCKVIIKGNNTLCVTQVFTQSKNDSFTKRNCVVLMSFFLHDADFRLWNVACLGVSKASNLVFPSQVWEAIYCDEVFEQRHLLYTVTNTVIIGLSLCILSCWLLPFSTAVLLSLQWIFSMTLIYFALTAETAVAPRMKSILH